MSADQLIAEFKALPVDQKKRVAEAILQDEGSWVPESFQQGMADIEAGRFVSMETALNEKPLSEA